ncbi:SAM-dependent methyltransferase [Mycolicibacterium arseniciresistens]|uniref:SAM-dependent methyltransferase n=1 Tax=Mycolicibacterium arseniciresistens TaxID=3062257 RepID=A0ABT8UK12_9MYCO|nr:SAM-dependent methyltransferase [Mycolicibacterium arseniciresistens]MDO3637165.1 SAM-dependent methyltransferase [Mycolicibacterium arseniciresistens]
MTSRLPDDYFERLYARAADPWQLQGRWYERRKYAITMALLPYPRYRHAYEPGCSVGVLTELLTGRCDHVTATDVASGALDATHRRLLAAQRRRQVTLLRQSIDGPWPQARFDLVVLSEVCYYLQPATLRAVLDRQVPLLSHGATVIAAHWRHRVEDYPMSGDHANDVIAATAGLHHIGGYRDTDVVIDVFDTASADSVAARTGVPGA